jgi:hypothetical protein
VNFYRILITDWPRQHASAATLQFFIEYLDLIHVTHFITSTPSSRGRGGFGDCSEAGGDYGGG